MTAESVPDEARATEQDTGWGCTFHRHFASNAIHRDGYVEDCDQPGSHREVYVFDPDYLEEHDAAIVAAAVSAAQADNNRRIEALAGLRSDAIEKIRTRWLNTKYVVPYEVKLDPRNLDYAQISRDFDALFAAIEVARAALASTAEPGGAE